MNLHTDAHDRALAATDLEHSYLVEAAAGTGKTTLLIARLLNVICSGRAAMHEIVAITFTEKAAGELKTKLRDGIEQAMSTGVVGREPYSRSIDDEKKQRLRDSMRDLDRAQVTTIHAFCQAMIRERPVEAGIDPLAEVASPLVQSLLLEEAWEHWRDTTLSQEATEVADALRAGIPLEPWETRGESVRTLFRALAGSRDLADCLPPLIDEEREWLRAQEPLRAAKAQTAMLRSFVKGSRGRDKANRLAREFEEAAQQTLGQPAVIARRALLTLNLKEAEKPDELGGPTQWRDPKKLDQLRDLLLDVHQRLLPATLAVLTHNVMVRLLHQGCEFLDVFQQLKSDRAALDFDDLLLLARNMLRDHAEARRYFKQKFAFILIDEFQDTDPLQAEIAFLLAQEDGDDDEREWTNVRVKPGKLFLVGDPKQSIYRFRRADIEIYEECGRLLSAQQELRPPIDSSERSGRARLLPSHTSATLHISRNFRSGSNLIDFVNRVFAPRIMRPADGSYQPDYVALEPGPAADSFGSEVVLLYPPAPEDADGGVDRIRYREGCCFARLIHHAVKEGWRTSRDEPLQYGDVAVLLRSFTGIEKYEQALRACEVPYRMAGGKFYQRIEIKSLIAAVNAIDSPEDHVAVVAALRSAFFGLSDEDLLRHVATGCSFNYVKEKAPPTALAEAFALLRELHTDRNRAPVALTLQKLCNATKVLVMFLLKPQGEQRVANLLKVIETARSLEGSGALTFRAFARWLREREQAEEEETESPLGEADDSFVQVMTIHKAKGLEFEMVVVADLNNKGSDKPDPLIVDRVQRKLDAGQSRVTTAEFPQAVAWDRRRRDAEFVRLFYVALTRAKSRLVLPVFWAEREPAGAQLLLNDHIPSLVEHQMRAARESEGGSAGHNCLATQLKGEAWPTPSESFRVKLEVDAKGGARGIDGKPAKELLAMRSQWLKALESSRAAAKAGAPIRAPSSDHDDADFASRYSDDPGGRRFGRLVHRMLELFAGAGAKEVGDVVRRVADELGANDKETAAARELVTKTLASSLWKRLRQTNRIFCEAPFVFTDNDGGLVEGVMDVIAEEGDGLLIIDWKTDDFDTLADELLERYAAQVRDYAAAAERATGKQVTEALLYFVRSQHARPVTMTLSSRHASTAAKPRQLALNLVS